MKKRTFFSLIIFLAALFMSVQGKAQIKMLSGVESEIYNEFANDIKANTNVPIEIVTTGGSVDNFSKIAVDSTKANLAFMQYDVLIWKEIENPKIKDKFRVFFPLYNEEIHIIVKNNSKIASLNDLKGKKVAVGSKSQGSYITSQIIKNKTGLTWEDIPVAFNDAFIGLLDGHVDAIIYVGGAPVNLLKSLSPEVNNMLKLLPIIDPRLEGLYTKSIIRAGTYPWAKYDVSTYAVRSVIVTNIKNESPEAKKNLTALNIDLKANLEKIKMSKTSHDKWKEVKVDYKGINWPLYK